MPLTAADLDRIESLAKAATPGARTVEDFGYAIAGEANVALRNGLRLTCLDDGELSELPIEEARYLAALDPDTVLALVEAARRGMACK